MSLGLRRIVGWGSVLVGFVFALWVVLGPPQDWEGEMRWLRHGLALGSVGVVAFAARLVFPDTQESRSGTLSD
jgi:hypothetical protein